VGEAGVLTSPEPGWSPWRPVPNLPVTTRDVVAETLDGGQAFRWQRLADDTWLGVWGRHVARLRLASGGRLEWSTPVPLEPGAAAGIATYFGADRDFAAAIDTLPWRSDPHLARCVEAFPGLRILRQPLGETLLCFLCSATKQIVQIKQMVALLAEKHGAKIGTAPVLGVRRTFFALPSWPALAKIPERELRLCLLGFRAKYIAQTAARLADEPDWLAQTEAMPYAEAKQRLCSLPGVGEKVADCVLLFGGGRLEAFPVDVWILRTMALRYGLEDWKPAPLTQFGRAHFGAFAGLGQQFLFAWERQAGRPLAGKG